MGGFLVSPLNCGCPPTQSPPGGYVTRWRIDPVTGCWWLLDQTIPAFSIPCPTQLSGPTGLSGGSGYGALVYGSAPGAGGSYSSACPSATYTNGTSCNQLVYYSVSAGYNARLNNTNQTTGYSRIAWVVQISTDGGSTFSNQYSADLAATGLYYDSPNYNAPASVIVGPGGTFRICVRLWWGNANSGSVTSDCQISSYSVAVPLFSLSQLPS